MNKQERAAYAGPCWDGCIHNESHLAALAPRDHELVHAEAVAARLRAEVRHIARTVMALPVLSWAHTDDCPGRPGMRGICACAMVPLVSRDAVLAAVAPTPAEWCEWAGWEGLL